MAWPRQSYVGVGGMALKGWPRRKSSETCWQTREKRENFLPRPSRRALEVLIGSAKDVWVFQSGTQGEWPDGGKLREAELQGGQDGVG
jgi:hypothetical protein